MCYNNVTTTKCIKGLYPHKEKTLKFKKLNILLATVVAAVGLITLSACGNNNSTGANIITMKGDTINVNDFYKQAKEFPGMPATSLLQNLTMSKMFEKDFGDKVSDKDVQAKFDETKKQMGDQFAAALQQQGFTESSYKSYVRLQLLQEYAIEKKISDTQYTDANLKAAWADFHPEVEAIVVPETTKDAATKARKSAKEDAAKFEKDNASNKQKFDSTSTTVPSEVQTAAFKLKNGEVSDVIESTNTSTGATSYYVVKMIKTSDKGSDMNKYKDQLKNVIKTQKMADTTYVAGVIGEYLKAHNVTVKEEAFSSIFSQFTSSSSK